MIFTPPLYNIKVDCKYPNTREANKLISILYKYRIEMGEYIDLRYETKYLSQKYSISIVNKWTANMALSQNIYIPIKLFNYLVNRHISVNYVVRLTDQSILEIQNEKFKKLKVHITQVVKFR